MYMFVYVGKKLFYVLFILSGNDDDDDDSLLNGRTLINLSPKSKWDSVLFGCCTKQCIIPYETTRVMSAHKSN